MFGKVFGRSSPDDKRRFHITMSAKKPVTLKYSPKGGEEILLGKETTVFKGEVEVEGAVDCIQCSFEGENLKTAKNYIKLEITY
jgi:hypothetical protein